MIILDFGSGNTCKNDLGYINKMIDELAEIDKKRRCIIKWQLFQKEGDNIPLYHTSFGHAYRYAKQLGFQTTASVFDLESLDFLLKFNIPFIKIANRPDSYWLAREVPRKYDVIVSKSPLICPTPTGVLDIKYLCCISKYPASIDEYEQDHSKKNLCRGISDHTTNWDLYRKYFPKIYECHYKLEDSTGLDAGEFARTPKQLKEIL